MEQHNFGDRMLELWDVERGWVLFIEAYIREGTEYKLRYFGERVDVRLQGVPLPFFKQENGFHATFHAPFQSGVLHVYINGHFFETYIYPDARKLTEEQYSIMLEEILSEASSCFQLNGLEMKVSVSGRTRQIQWTQWSYIAQSFQRLRQIFSKIKDQPFRRLEKHPVISKRGKIQRAENATLRWLDQKGHGKAIPINVLNIKTSETLNVYENQVIKQQLKDLYQLLRKYEAIEHGNVARNSRKFRMVVQSWLNSPFLNEVMENEGPYTITQKFRKHPVYRLWYQWFERLYKHKREGVGFDYPIPLKDTFDLYEMWCYMRIVKILREAGFVMDSNGLFRTNKDGIFLNLAKNRESLIRLNGQVSLYFQRSYQYNSKNYHTFTQMMIPDIVLEGKNGIIIFDPKYRIPDNLGTALGEMHKYRDGIIHRETGKRAVQEVYILTPTKEIEGMRYFQDDFYERYKMGAIQMIPGVDDDCVKSMVIAFVEELMNAKGI